MPSELIGSLEKESQLILDAASRLCFEQLALKAIQFAATIASLK